MSDIHWPAIFATLILDLFHLLHLQRSITLIYPLTVSEVKKNSAQVNLSVREAKKAAPELT